MRFVHLAVSLVAIAAALVAVVHAPRAHEVTDPALVERFEFLSRNGNSACSLEFMQSIATLPDGSRLQGSCCSPMNLERYGAQVTGLRKLSAVAIVPPDPYDVDAALARRLLAAYDLELTGSERARYDEAVSLSDEGGPCCCQCWRWSVYGGLAKLLIREHGFDGPQVAEVWDLSDGCGGAEHQHGAT
jgi:hypothetical protein